MRRRLLVPFLSIVFSSLFFAELVIAQQGGARGRCGPPPPPKRQRIAGGESSKPPSRFPVVSKLPCAPTRRTEKKMPPSPPTLVAKLSFGANQDWTTDRNDIHNLLKIIGRQYQTPFRAVVVNFENYSFKPDETPVVYMSGHNPFELDSPKRRRLRDFLERGGTLIIDSCCGSEKFATSAKAEIRKMFPDRRFKRLPLDHPVFWAHYKIRKVSYCPLVTDRPNREPYLEGVDLGCRTAVFFSPYDLSCGWDNHTHPHGKRVAIRDAIQLGVNMLSYALVNRREGEVIAQVKAYTDADSETRGKLVMAQIKYSGEWNRHAAATSNLLLDLDKKLPAEVKYARADVALSDPKIFSFPLLYITGHDDFRFTSAEISNLRKYLEAGGTLLAESCCGRQDFDKAFRREIAKVLPRCPLKELSNSHPFLSVVYDLTRTALPERISECHPGRFFPMIEAIELNGATAVIYSPYGLSCGWEGDGCKYCLGYPSNVAVKIGVNALAYALSH